MNELGLLAASLLLGIAGGALAVRLGWRRAAAADSRAEALAAILIRLSHDLRGALSPALILAERLEAHPDAKVRDAARLISAATERATQLCRDASVETRHLTQADARDAVGP
jgi:hypothetical protein